LRWRIEHASFIREDDIPRFSKLGVIASVQGIFATSDGPWVGKRLGPERTESGAYVWRKLWDAGALVINGTDAPVEDMDPIQNFYATVSRRQADGKRFTPEEGLSREQALKAATINAAYGAFEEKSKGSLSVGKLADIVVLSRNILTVREDEILGTQVKMTIVGGKVLYDSASAKP
jgi:predicted amidohydrolase YtcJ